MYKTPFRGLSEYNKVAGQYHPKAVLNDDQVEHLRRLYDTKMIGYKTLAKYFKVSRCMVRDIVTYKRRNVAITRFARGSKGLPKRGRMKR